MRLDFVHSSGTIRPLTQRSPTSRHHSIDASFALAYDAPGAAEAMSGSAHHNMKSILKTILWTAIALAGAGALAAIAFERREPLNAVWFVVAALCTYLVAYRFYSKFIAAKVLALDNTRATPAERLEDGHDFVPTSKWVLIGHHFAAIAG